MLPTVVRERTRTDLGQPRLVRGPAAAILGGCLGLVGCTPDVGLVELNWTFVDRQARPFVPSDLRKDTCAIPAQDEHGSTTADLIVQLTLSHPDLSSGASTDVCRAPGCARFSCGRRRGTVDDVPASDDPYVMSVDVLVVPARGNEFLAPPRCIAVPGPRRRNINGGALTDLSVYQFVVHNIDAESDEASRLDLEQCREPDA